MSDYIFTKSDWWDLGAFWGERGARSFVEIKLAVLELVIKVLDRMRYIFYYGEFECSKIFYWILLIFIILDLSLGWANYACFVMPSVDDFWSWDILGSWPVLLVISSAIYSAGSFVSKAWPSNLIKGFTFLIFK